MTAASIWQATSAAEFAHARALFEEYAQWLAIDLCFQGFAEELATLPGAYAPPRGRLLLAGPREMPTGCVALRPLPDPGAGEVKRMYVRPAVRGSGLGEALMQTLIAQARVIGYRELKLDTLGSMAGARRLYARLGFAECAPYYHNPTPGVVYLARAL